MEITIWKEVDIKDELPDIKSSLEMDNPGEQQSEFINCLFKDGNIRGQWYHPKLHEFHPEITHWLKRIVIQILNNEQVEERAIESLKEVDKISPLCLTEEEDRIFVSGFIYGWDQRFEGRL